MSGLVRAPIQTPTELAVGVGPTVEPASGETSGGVNFGLAWIYVRHQWIEPTIEMGLGPTSSAVPCLEDAGPVARPETCMDGYVMAGVRLRPLRKSDRLHRRFVSVFAGEYWTGSGLKAPEDFLPGRFALQLGGGLDICQPGSIHGLRLSGDYRRVFAGEPRQQLQFVVSYFVGWRGQERPKPPTGDRPIAGLTCDR